MVVGAFVFLIIVTFLIVACLLYEYGNWNKHPISVTLSVFIAWYFSFIIIFILPLDVSSTAYRQCLLDKSDFFPTLKPATPLPLNSSQVNKSFNVVSNCSIPWSYMPVYIYINLWSIVYWTSQFLTWILLPIMKSYSTAGEFTIPGKLKTAVKGNLISYATYLFIFGLLLFYLIFIQGIRLNGSGFKVLSITASNTWGLFLFVLLAGYGLIEIPRSCWNTTDSEYMLRLSYFKAHKLYDEKYEAEGNIDDLIEVVIQISKLTPDDNPDRPFVDVILQKIPDEKKAILIARRFSHSPISRCDVSQERLVELHKQMIRAVHTYHQTIYQWNLLLKQAYHWHDVVENNKNEDRVFKRVLKPEKPVIEKILCHPKIEWYWHCKIRIWVFQILSIILGVFSFSVIWCEMTFFTRHPTISFLALIIESARDVSSYGIIEGLSMATIAYVCICTYYTLFHIKVFNYYYLASHHQTNEYSLIFCGMFLCRLTPPLCLNFLGMIHLDSHIIHNTNMEETAYTQIMGHMDVIGIITNGFNIYFPIFIFVVCLVTYSNMCRRLLHFIGFEEFLEDDDMVDERIDEGRRLIRRGTSTQSNNFAPQLQTMLASLST